MSPGFIHESGLFCSRAALGLFWARMTSRLQPTPECHRLQPNVPRVVENAVAERREPPGFSSDALCVGRTARAVPLQLWGHWASAGGGGLPRQHKAGSNRNVKRTPPAKASGKSRQSAEADWCQAHTTNRDSLIYCARAAPGAELPGASLRTPEGRDSFHLRFRTRELFLRAVPAELKTCTATEKTRPGQFVAGFLQFSHANALVETAT